MAEAAYMMSIGGRSVAGAGEMDVVNPADGRAFAKAPDASREQLDMAVDAARKAFPQWSQTPIEERKALVSRLGDAIQDNLEPLKRLLTREQGKPLADAEWEIGGSAQWCQAGAMLELPIETNEDSDERISITRHVPLGVVGAIAPWNFPVILAIWKIVPALIAGNTIVVKPSPFTPLSTLKVGELAQSIFPPGVFNVVSGGDNLGPWMTSHPGIDKISFTGSTATGKKVMESASKDLKRITLELGGNDAAIVMPDVDVEQVVPELFWAAFKNTGQICVATKRMYVHNAIYDQVADGLADYARQVAVGDGAQQGVQLGPVQNKLQYDRVLRLMDGAKAENLRFLVGGEPIKSDGYFIPVTIVDNPPDDAPVVTEEAFGPVLPLLRFEDVDDVVRRVNATSYGLGGSIWTSDLEAARRIGERLRCGTVWVNETQYLTPFAPFAGHGQSGFGVENGVSGLLEYAVPQTVSIRKKMSVA